jgi:hypothetical protein
MEAVDCQSLHLLPFDYCGKVAVVTPLVGVIQLKK